MKNENNKTKDTPETKKVYDKKTIILALCVALAVIGVSAFVFFGKPLYLAGIVNGKPIFRWQTQLYLEKTNGSQALDYFVYKTLILDAAKKNNLKVEQSVVDEEVKMLEEQYSAMGESLETVLKENGVSLSDLREQIYIKKVAELAVKDKIGVTEEEVNAFVEANKEMFPEGTSDEEMKAQAYDQIAYQKQNIEINAWIESLKSAGNVEGFGNYKLKQ